MTPKMTQKTSGTPKVRRPKHGHGTRTSTKTTADIVDAMDASVQVHVFKIGETRQKLPQMVARLQTGISSSYVVGPYGRPSVALVSYERFRPLLASSSKEERFALLVVDELLPDAPQHLWTSAIKELSALPKSDLLCLWKLTAASTDDEIATIRTKMLNPTVLDRLVVRARVAKSIAEARVAGLYDAAEDLASMALSE